MAQADRFKIAIPYSISAYFVSNDTSNIEDDSQKRQLTYYGTPACPNKRDDDPRVESPIKVTARFLIPSDDRQRKDEHIEIRDGGTVRDLLREIRMRGRAALVRRLSRRAVQARW